MEYNMKIKTSRLIKEIAVIKRCLVTKEYNLIFEHIDNLEKFILLINENVEIEKDII